MKLNKIWMMLIVTLIISMFTAGCGGGTSTITPSTSSIVTNNVTEITSWEDVLAISRNTPIWIRLGMSGTSVSQLPCILIAAKTEQGENLITCTIATTTVMPGDSGSPIGWFNPSTKRDEVIGMLCYGTGSIGDNNTFKARYIGDVLSISKRQIRNTSLTYQASLGYKPIEDLRFISGLSQAGLDRLKKLGLNPNLTLTSRSRNTRGGPASLLIPLVAGMKVSVNSITGDIYTGGAIGTAGYVTAENAFTFGHTYNHAGECDIPISIADVTLRNGGLTPFIDATALPDQILGSLTKDYDQGGMIELEKVAQTISVTLNSVISGKSYNHYHTIGKGNPNSYISMATMGAVDYDRAKWSKGTIIGTAKLIYTDGEVDVDLACSDDSDVTSAMWPLISDALDTNSERDLVSIDMSAVVTDDYAPPVTELTSSR